MTDANQRAFNTAYRGLASQGFHRSTKPGKAACLYRGAEGRRCAAGWLIPDDQYLPEMEVSGGIYALKEDGLWPFDSDLLPEFLFDLQCAHDEGTTPEMMMRRLADFAARFELTIPA